MLVTEEDIAFSLEKSYRYDLFFFFGSFAGFDRDIRLFSSLIPLSRLFQR